MVARGALQIPNLSYVIKDNSEVMSWRNTLMLLQYYSRVDNQWDSGWYHLARIKQWLRFLLNHFIEAEQLFAKLKYCQNNAELQTLLDKECNEI